MLDVQFDGYYGAVSIPPWTTEVVSIMRLLRKASAAAILAVLFASLQLAIVRTPAQAGQWWSVAISGHGTTTGTAMYYTTWPTGYATPPESPSFPCTQSYPYCQGGSVYGFTAES